MHSPDPVEFTADLLQHASAIKYDSRHAYYMMTIIDGGCRNRGGRRTPPFAFTEQGVAMLSSVLNSERAIEVNIAIMRAFVCLRAMLATHADRGFVYKTPDFGTATLDPNKITHATQPSVGFFYRFWRSSPESDARCNRASDSGGLHTQQRVYFLKPMELPCCD